MPDGLSEVELAGSGSRAGILIVVVGMDYGGIGRNGRGLYIPAHEGTELDDVI